MSPLNRIVWSILGVVAAAAGTIGFAVTVGWATATEANEIVPFQDIWEWWTQIDWSDGNLWILAGIACGVVIVAGVFAVRQLVPNRPHDDPVVIQRDEHGVTRVSPAALRKAAGAEATLIPGVTKARFTDLRVDGTGTHGGFVIDINAPGDAVGVAEAALAQANRSLTRVLGDRRVQLSATVRVRRDNSATRNVK
jgi:hypothetical protein